jgi:hypothetical protein
MAALASPRATADVAARRLCGGLSETQCAPGADVPRRGKGRQPAPGVPRFPCWLACNRLTLRRTIVSAASRGAVALTAGQRHPGAPCAPLIDGEESLHRQGSAQAVPCKGSALPRL